MSSLREIKDRIASVRSTLKITSAMKLVSSAKLRKAQKAIEGLRPYESALNDILAALMASGSSLHGTSASLHPSQTDVWAPPVHGATGGHGSVEGTAGTPGKRVAVVVISSNSSLCGGFNANVIKKAVETIRGFESDHYEVEVIPLGRKAADAMRKAGYLCDTDYSDLVGHPGYEKTAGLAKSVSDRHFSGELEKVVLVYNHFVSTAKQTPVAETYLPFEYKQDEKAAESSVEEEFIVEPGADEVVSTMLPQVLMLKFYAAILDSQAAEQAARTVAMQTASDNAEELLGDLTLEYNKGRQQKITAEILDLLGGSAAQQ